MTLWKTWIPTRPSPHLWSWISRPISPLSRSPPITHRRRREPPQRPRPPPPPLPPADNPPTVEGVALGRRLYYDTLLSLNGPFQGRACASCHEQSRSFTVPSTGTSVLPHVNLAWNTHFLWNGKVSGTLEDVMRFEVDDFFEVDVNVLRSHPEYPTLFQQALGTSLITRDAVARALAQWFLQDGPGAVHPSGAIGRHGILHRGRRLLSLPH